MLHSPSQCVLPGEETTTVVTLVAPLLQMHALVMSLQIRLAHKLLGAICDGAGKRVLSLFVVSLHVGFVIIAAAE